jgi:hypothetical protein
MEATSSWVDLLEFQVQLVLVKRTQQEWRCVREALVLAPAMIACQPAPVTAATSKSLPPMPVVGASLLWATIQ